MSTKNNRARFDALRAQYVAAHEAEWSYEIGLISKYGQVYWASTAEKRKWAQLTARTERAAAKLFALIDAVSPRNWRSGVPAHWVSEQLSWEDATRPLNEPLAVTPPLAYGHTEAMR